MALGGLGRSTKPSAPGWSLPALWEAQFGVLLPWLPAENSRICSADLTNCPASSHSVVHGDWREGQEMHEPEMVSSPGCGINSQGQGADPHSGNLIEESLLAILGRKKTKQNTPVPGADCTRTPRQGAWHGAVHAARLWLGARSITKLEDTANSSLTSSLMAVSAPPGLKCP